MRNHWEHAARITGVVTTLWASASTAAETPRGTASFIDQHCAGCHDDTEKKGGLDLTSLAFQPDRAANVETWIKVHDRVVAGEMPPKKKPRPAADELTAFTGAIARELVSHEQNHDAINGRASRRRLNREEYENALRDLLHAPWLQLKVRLPEDPVAHHYNKISAALDLSHDQLAHYLEVAEFALREVLAPQVEPPPATIRRYYARAQPSFTRNTKKHTNEPERMVIPVNGYVSQYELFGKKGPMTVGDSDPATREIEGFVEIASQMDSYWMWFDQFNAPIAGRYKLRFHTFSAWIGPSAQEPGMPPRWWIPDLANVGPSTRTEPVTVYAETFPRNYRIVGKFDAPTTPGVNEIETSLLKGETIHPDAARFFRSRQGFWRYRNPLATEAGSPGVGFRWLEVEGPLIEQWPSAGHRLLFGDLPLRTVTPAKKGDPAAEVVSAAPAVDAERLLRNFLTQAYRRPFAETDVKRFLGVAHGVLLTGGTFTDAMITAYTAVLSSPQFLTVQEKPGALDDHALAERLAFFLQNTSPDAELRAVAAAGRLRDPAVLRAQTDRLLAAPPSAQFVTAFTDFWLDLRKVSDVSPDPVMYSDYYLDDLLNESALEETRAFFGELISKNLPARNLVDSDFVMVNEKLATLYGLTGVEGVAIRRVPVPAGSPRGGLLTQASVLKVTTNGNSSSPVKRGAWIMDRILGKPPSPPPPNVPAVEADTRGATTIREQLDLHRNDATCAACHRNIDPPGFALENFDVAGGWRTRYRGVDQTVPAVEGAGRVGQRFEFHYALPVDAQGEMPDGTRFADIHEFKKILLRDETQLARNVATQLVTYATGAPVRFSDRGEIEKILARAQPSQFGIRTLILEVVQSELFLRK